MRYCPECGEEIQPGAKFCPECGTELETARVSGPRPSRGTGRAPIGFGLLRATSMLEIVLGVAFLTLDAFSLSSAVALLILSGAGGTAVVAGYGVLRKRSWSRLAGTLAGGVLVLVGVLFVVTLNALLAPLGAAGMLIGVALAVQLRMRSAEKYLGIKAPVPSVD